MEEVDRIANEKRIFFFWTASQGITLSKGEDILQSQQGHVRDAEGRSAGLLLALNIPPCPKKKKNKEKASVKISTSLKIKTRFTWEPQSVTVQSDSLASLTNPQFQSAHTVKRES